MADAAPAGWTRAHTEAMQMLADTYLNQDMAGRARIILAALHQMEPDNADILKALARAYLEQGEAEKAVETADLYIAATELDSRTAAILMIKAKALSKLGGGDELQRCLAQFAALRS